MNNDIAQKNRNFPTSYKTLLSDVQKAQTEALWELTQSNITDKEREEKVKAFIKKQIEDRKVNYEGFTEKEIEDKLYNDIERYSILTEYLEDDNVEGININAWDNIRVKYHSEKEIKAEPFLSPQQATIILQRLLQHSDMTIDESIPIAEGSINNNIRIEAVMHPLVDKEVGIASYIRKLRDKVFTDEEYIKYGFANRDILNFITIACRRGMSVLIVGKVNTGKTTFLKYILNSMPDEMQINTIESGAREFNLIKYDKHGNPINNVVHLLSRPHKDERMNITQEKLVVVGLRLNGDLLPVAEMRDVEAYSAIEASNAGNIVVSTAHAGSAQYAHTRIANLARKKYTTDFHTAHIDACQAFPLCVFIHTGDDGVRRIMNVCECYVENDKVIYNTIFEFEVEDNIEHKDGKVQVIGEFKQINNPSQHMISHMKMYGITKKELNSLLKKQQ